jgi:DNA processing protein
VDSSHDTSPQTCCDGGGRDDEVDAVLRLVSVPGIGVGRLRALRESFGGFAGALAAGPEGVAAALRIDASSAARMMALARDGDDVSRAERLHAAGCGASIRMLADDEYPDLLRASPDPPELLFVRGELGALPEPAVAIVGSRRATAYGKLEAGRLAAELAERGVTIVSGGARGIDAEAHRGAMRAGGRTIAVLASGFAHPYPAEHAPLFDAIVDAGGTVLTEQLSGIEPRPDLFPRRNRIIAALSLVTVVIEAATRSGALLTARIAVDDLSRDAACLPGPVGSALSAGCHKAIREGWASLVTSADDVCELLVAARQLAVGAVESAGRGGPSVGRRRCEGERDEWKHPRSQDLEGKNPESKPTASKPAESNKPESNKPESKKRESRNSESRERESRSVESQARSSGRSAGDSPQPAISTDAGEVVVALKRFGAAVIDELALELEWEFPRLALALLELERVGHVSRDAHGLYAWKGGAARKSG